MLNDVRQAFRLLARNPGFTLVACLILALGIGANAAIFSVVDAALFKPLPYKDADRLVDVYQVAQSVDGERFPILFEGHADIVREIRQVFEGVEAFSSARPMALATGTDQSPWVGGLAPALPAFLGVRPQIGRDFTREDVLAHDTIILSDGFWQRAFGRDPGVLGKTIAFADRSCVVVGVMASTFRYFVGARADAWLPIDDRDGSNFAARLRPGLTLEQAQRDLDAALMRLPPSPRPLQLQIREAEWNRIQASTRTMLLSVMAAVGFVLLIACANVANLLLARTLGRQREIAVRGALGATRGQLVRQFLIEGLVLAGLGGVVAAAVAWIGIRVIPAIMPGSLSQSLLGVSLPHLDLRVLAFDCLAVLFTGILCGVVPALRASRSAAGDGLLAGGQRIAGSSRGQRRIRIAFQTLQIALTLVLLAGAGLLIGSVLRMVNTPSGFDADRLGYVSLTFPPQSLPLQSQKSAVADELVARLSVLSGVRGVALGPPPVAGGTSTIPLAPENEPSHSVLMRTNNFYVSANYFQVAGIGLKEGRPFGPEDQPNAPHVVIISENAAGRLWPGRSAVGERLQRGTHKEAYTVVGVLPHLRTIELANDDVQLFFPMAQGGFPSSVVLRTTGDIGTVAASVRAEVLAINPRVIIQRIGTVDHLFAELDPIGSPRFYAVLLGSLAGLGLLTAAVGLYGLLSYTVSQRTREIGVRVALGADRARVRRLVLRDAFGPVALGIGGGVVAALWLSKFLASQLFHVTPQDPTTFAMMVALLVIVSGLAVVAPVLRATRIDPVDALRAE
jgi:predicted permease